MTTITEKTFAFAGVAEKNGTYFVRFANDAMRAKALAKDGQTDIRFVQLPEPMTKTQAVELLQPMDGFQDENAQHAFADYLAGPTATGNTRANRQLNESGDQLYTFAGIACKKGEFKVRWANTADRVKALIKDGQTDVHLVQLTSAMTKRDAVLSIMDLEEFDYLEAQHAFDDFIGNVKIIKLDKPTEVVDTMTDEELEEALA